MRLRALVVQRAVRDVFGPFAGMATRDAARTIIGGA